MTLPKTRPHNPMLAEWTSEIFSLSFSLTDTECLSILNARVLHIGQWCSCRGMAGLTTQPRPAGKARETPMPNFIRSCSLDFQAISSPIAVDKLET